MTITELPGFQDSHVHLALIDPAALAGGGIARVVDLGGWTPAATGTPAPTDCKLPVVSYAGQFLTAPGGYPSRQPWAPAGSSCAVSGPADAAAAVDRQVDAGASVIKVTLNTSAGPVLSPDALDAIVHRAHERGLPVVAHAEGAGQALAAHLAGVDALAHTPFTELLPEEVVAAMAKRMSWISTLDIHGWGDYGADFELAVDNLRRFNQHGGRVLYGTDLGNGPLPVGLNPREIAALLTAGLSPGQVILALCAEGLGAAGASPGTAGVGPGPGPGPGNRVAASSTRARPAAPASPARTTVLPTEQPADPAEFAAWICTARALTAAEREDLR